MTPGSGKNCAKKTWRPRLFSKRQQTIKCEDSTTLFIAGFHYAVYIYRWIYPPLKKSKTQALSGKMMKTIFYIQKRSTVKNTQINYRCT